MDMTKRVRASGAGDGGTLRQPYLLLTFIPWARGRDGRIWMDDLWARDLLLHLDYIERLMLLAPEHDDARFPSNWIALPAETSARIAFIALPRMDSRRRMLIGLPRIVATIWRAVGRAEILHSGVVGWPIPLGWIANPIALIRRKKLFLVVESSPWRAGSQGSAWARWRSRMFERIATCFLDRADLCLFTSEAYRKSLLVRPRGKSIVVPASWIARPDIVGDAQSWRKPDGADAAPRFFCPSRLTAVKGIPVLIEAIAILERRAVRCTIDLMGDGELKERCKTLSRTLSHVRVEVLDPVPYGSSFFTVLQRYDCIVVPLIMDEQPRIIFDAYSQARPVLASATSGVVAHVADTVTGWLVRPGDPVDLADRIEAIARDTSAFEPMGRAARSHAAAHTHETMHARRRTVLVDLFGDGANA